MKQTNDILAQEPQVEPVQEQNLGDVKGYIAYLNLDWLDMIFAQEGWQGDVQRQEEFINSLQDGLADVVLRQKKGMMLSYSWYDNEKQLRRAIEVMPLSAVAVGLQIVTPDVSGYEKLNKRLTELECENARLKNQIRSIGEELRVKGVVTERAFRAYFNRQPGGLVEQYEKKYKEE
jgi:hypothetical protein